MTIEEALSIAFGKKSGTQLDEQIVIITLAREVERLSQIDKALTEYRRKERHLLGIPDDAREEDHLDAISRLREANKHLRQHGCCPENDGQTHHATCWRTRGHHECAINRVEHLESMLSNSEALGCYYNDESMRLQQRVEELEDFARDISDNYDCDTDAHRYRTTCRACKAKKILKGVDAE